MDMVKIGKFLAELRHEQGMTQAELGEKIGISSKTISRWETGTYLPPVEMLLLLSDCYQVSINELLSGKRLDADTYPEQAEENLKTVLSEPAFSTAERVAYFRDKWHQEHRFSHIVVYCLFTAMFIVGIVWIEGLQIPAFLLWIGYLIMENNRKEAYIDAHLYPEVPLKTKNDNG